MTITAIHKAHKGDVVAVFGETTHYERPFVRFKGICLKRTRSGEYLIRRTHRTHDDGISYQEVPSPLGRHLETAVHRLDIFPGTDDVATRAELKRRIAEWEAADPKRLTDWQADQARTREASRKLSVEVSKIMRRFL